MFLTETFLGGGGRTHASHDICKMMTVSQLLKTVMRNLLHILLCSNITAQIHDADDTLYTRGH